MRIFILTFLLLALFAYFPSFAGEKTPQSGQENILKIQEKSSTPTIFYSKDTIKIHRKKPPATEENLPWKKPEETVEIGVELKASNILYNQNGLFNFSSYSEKQGVMVSFSEVTTPPIQNSANYAPVDILFIDAQGKITQIAPSLVLANLEQDIVPANPILAVLFLKGGACTLLSIAVGDEVEYAIFKKPPVILGGGDSSK